MAGLTCVVCTDETSKVVFSCKTRSCKYHLCIECIRLAFEDATGAHSSKCPMCKQEISVKLVEAVCGGPRAVRAVEGAVRSSVEFEVQNRLLVKRKKSAELSAMSDKARSIFNEITEKMVLKCPRCKKAFIDYDGCNALSCGCGCRFCSICLEDCGTNAHPHVRQHHGDLFDKPMFEKAKAARQLTVVQDTLEELRNEPEELSMLVKNHMDRAGLLVSGDRRGIGNSRIGTFVSESKADLLHAIRMDRLSVLSSDAPYSGAAIRERSVSPRCAIPKDFRLQLRRHEGNSYDVLLFKKNERGGWDRSHLPKSDDPSDQKKFPDILMNLSSSLSCAVVALDGQRCLYQTKNERSENSERNSDKVEVSLSFIKVDSKGDADHDCGKVFGGTETILAFNPNRRLLLLQSHVQREGVESLVSLPVRHAIGADRPTALFDRLDFPVQRTLVQLNDEQRKVAHPLQIKSALEVAGPPGTGKTKTITELTRSILSCTDLGIVVLSERNGAIDAIAEKVASASLVLRENKIVEVSDVPLWTSVMTWGASSMGNYTKMFTLSEKLKYHPELVALRRKQDELGTSIDKEAKQQRKRIAAAVAEVAEKYDRYDLADHLARQINRDGSNNLSRPTEIIDVVSDCHKRLNKIAVGNQALQDEIVKQLERDFSFLIEGLFRDSELNADIIKKQMMPKLCRRLKKLLSLEIFDMEKATAQVQEYRNIGNLLEKRREEIRVDLLECARLKMSTIGSSHLMPTKDRKDHHRDDLADSIGGLRIDDSEEKSYDDTILIFDEAGCIPAYELLGMSRLACEFKSLVMVGDSHQLPPYDPGSGRREDRTRGFQRHQNGSNRRPKSLLDVSRLSQFDCKVELTQQYRVPRDIADLLNARIYYGKYSTAQGARVERSGFRFENIPHRSDARKRYVNANEINRVVQLVLQKKDEGHTSILVLTPYKNQQQQIRFRLRDSAIDDVPVLTIDQCQGQEADYVILSLVRKPTRFLNKNRLNVALSRVRKELYLLADKALLREASRDKSWDCNLLASDLLQLSP